MAKSRMMDPRYAKAIKSKEELFTPIELEQMRIDPKNMIKTTNCNPYFESTYTDKNKLKNTFIKNSESGLYEFFAKEVECSQDFINQARSLKDSFVKTNVFYTKEQKKRELRKLVEYEKKMDLLFRNLSKICQSKAKGLCGISDKSNYVYSKENLKEIMINEKGGIDFIEKKDKKKIKREVDGLTDEQVIEAIKIRNPKLKELLKMSDEELGYGRKMLLMLNGFEKDGQGWKYSKELEDKFVEAASICRKNYLCVKTEFSDIPKEIGRFTEEILDGISKPYDYMFSKSMKMFGVSKKKSIERQEAKKKKLADKIKRLTKEKKALNKKKSLLNKMNPKDPIVKKQKKDVEKRLNRIEKGQTLGFTTKSKNSLQTLQIKRNDAKYRAKRKQKELERMSKKKSSDYLNKISKITPERLREKQRLTNAVRKTEQKRLNKKIKSIEDKQGSKTGLTRSQKRDLEGRFWKPSLKTRRKNAETYVDKKKRLTKEKSEILKRISSGETKPGDYARLKRITKGKSSFRSPFTKKGFRSPFTKKNSLGKLEGKNINTRRLDRRKELYEALKTKKANKVLTRNEQLKYNLLTQGDVRRAVGIGKKSVHELQGLSRKQREIKRKQNNLNILRAQYKRINQKTPKGKEIKQKIKNIQGKLALPGKKLVRQIRENAIQSVKEEKGNNTEA